MNIDGYPAEEELTEIRNYDCVTDVKGFIELLESVWNNDYGTFELKGKTLKLVTGGWSGNEDILSAIPQIFDMAYWYSSKRGGLHIYKFGNIKLKSKP